MGLFTGLMIGMGVATAASQIMGGRAAKDEANYNASIALSESEYNASVLRKQAGMVDEQKKLLLAQDNRAIRMIMGETIAVTAGRGIELSGSPMAIMIDIGTQMEMDKMIGQYNLDVQKFGILSQAESVTRAGRTRAAQYRRAGKTAERAGYTGALTTLFKTGAYVGMKSFDTSGGAVKASSGRTKITWRL